VEAFEPEEVRAVAEALDKARAGPVYTLTTREKEMLSRLAGFFRTAQSMGEQVHLATRSELEEVLF